MHGEGGRGERHDEGGAALAFPTLEAMWRDYGESLPRLAETRIGAHPEAVDAACHAVMERAGRWIEVTRRPVADPSMWWWLRRLCLDVCDEIARYGVDRARVTAEPLPSALPDGLRGRLRILAAKQDLERVEAVAPPGPIALAQRRDRARWREAFERRLRDLPVVVAFPRLASRIWDGLDRAGRGAWRRAESAASTMVPSTQRVASFLTAGPGLSEAAAIITAVAAVGIVGPAGGADGPAGVDPTMPATSDIVAVTAPRLPEYEPMRVPEDVRPVVEEDPIVPAPPPEEPAEPESDPPPLVSEPEVAATATVTADPANTAEEPVQQKSVKDGNGTWYYASAGVDVTVDADDDGEDDAVFRSPQTGFSCAPPGEQGTTGSVVCPALEESGMPSEPRD